MAHHAPVPKKKPRSGTQKNIRFPADLIDRVEKAANWEGLTFSAYVRSSLLRRVRATEAERAKEESGKSGR